MIDPDEHMDACVTQVNLYTNDDAILCLVFPTSLKGIERDESLRAFVKHFSTVAIKIRYLSSKVALHSMITTLKPRLFSNSLCKKPPASMNELRERASRYIQMEEMTKFRDNVKVEHAVKP
ncbi:hypothetical protein CR513_11780, partial [Mucuna pruriens]